VGIVLLWTFFIRVGFVIAVREGTVFLEKEAVCLRMNAFLELGLNFFAVSQIFEERFAQFVNPVVYLSIPVLVQQQGFVKKKLQVGNLVILGDHLLKSAD
jgi:hypothetical protein